MNKDLTMDIRPIGRNRYFLDSYNGFEISIISDSEINLQVVNLESIVSEIENKLSEHNDVGIISYPIDDYIVYCKHNGC